MPSGGVIDPKKRKEWSTKGGHNRAKSMTAKERSEIARNAANVRWAKIRKNKKAAA